MVGAELVRYAAGMSGAVGIFPSKPYQLGWQLIVVFNVEGTLVGLTATRVSKDEESKFRSPNLDLDAPDMSEAAKFGADVFIPCPCFLILRQWDLKPAAYAHVTWNPR